MATIITVHGTWAHTDGPPPGAAQALVQQADPSWWQSGSALDRDLRRLLATEDGHLEVRAFEWSGANSEMDRRAAGSELRQCLLDLEDKGEKYCLVGHSHGGSVIAAALIECAGYKEQLPGLQRWITVGTPFIELKREPFLITRLDLWRKVAFVASTMLLVMFLVYLAAEAMSGETALIGGNFTAVLVATGVMMCLPVLVFYGLLKWWDNRSLMHHRPRVKQRAAEYFKDRWRSLTHPDDEAVQGLGYLPSAKLQFFDKSFAVSTLTLVSVLALPLLYLSIVTSPAAIVGIADWLKQTVYDAPVAPEVEKTLRDFGKGWRDARQAEQQPTAPGARTEARPRGREEVRREFRSARGALEAKYGDIRAAERAFRFKHRFFERGDQPCPGGKLCGEGRDFRINSALLLHICTDELAWALGGLGGNSTLGWIGGLVAPAVLVPVGFGLLALVLMLLIRFVARLISAALCTMLNNLTSSEVKRAAFGNDSEAEIAVAAVDRPCWLDASPPRLPAAIADTITRHSDGAASQSIAKFRRVIGQLSASERNRAETALTTYFTWSELVHSSYFDVETFRKLVARAIAAVPAFAPSHAFLADPDFARAGQWLAEIEGAPAIPAPGATPPDASDAAAVSAVVASTVKAEP